jgi:Fe-S cluster assembly protein SufB
MSSRPDDLDINDEYKYGFHDPEVSVFKPEKGLSEELVRAISAKKDEPEWMLEFRLKALATFYAKPMPTWGSGLLETINFDEIYYYLQPVEEQGSSWDDVPEYIKNTFEKLGIPEAEKKFLAGVSAQYESEVVYHSLQEEIEKQGVIFLDMDSGLREHEELVRKYFATVIPAEDNKFSALNSAGRAARSSTSRRVSK